MKKIISLVVFAVFYILSIYTSNFPYPEHAKQPTALLFSLLAILSFLCVTAIFSKSKGFLITVSAYFVIVLIVSTLILFAHLSSFSLIYGILVLIFLSFGLPIEHFIGGITDLLKNLNINISNNFEFYVFFTLIIALFYSTYFISRKLIKGEKQ